MPNSVFRPSGSPNSARKAPATGGFPHVRALSARRAASDCPVMPYTDPMTVRDTGTDNMTRESLACRGTGKVCLWQERGSAACCTRKGRRHSPHSVPCRCHLPILAGRRCWRSSAQWPAMPPTPIMPPNARAEPDRHSTSSPGWTMPTFGLSKPWLRVLAIATWKFARSAALSPFRKDRP